MAILGSSTYELKTDNSRFNRGLAKAERSSRESAKRIAGNFAKIGAGVLAAGGAIGFGLFKLVGQASDLNESINAVNVVFGEGKDIILDFSRTTSTAVGLASADFNQLSAMVGSLFTNFGLSEREAAEATINLTKRAADLASVHNTTVKDAMSALASGIRGETEPLRRYAADVSDATLEVHLLKQGIDKKVTSMSQAEKGLLRYEVAMATTAKVEGDFTNTSEDAANATRILKAQIKDAAAVMGQGLLPVVEAVLPWLQAVVTGFQAWAEANPKLMQALVIAAAAVAGLAVAIGGLLLVAASAMLVFSALGAAMLITVGWIALTVLAVIALAAAGVWLVKNWDKAKSSLVSVFATVKSWLQPVVDLFNNWADNNPKLMRALVVARQAVDGLTMALGWLVDKAKAAWQAIRDFAEEQWEKLKNVWENVEEAWAEDIDPALEAVLEKFRGLPGGVQIALLGAAATMAGSILAMLTVWTGRMLAQFAVWTATSLRRMAVWTAQMLVRFAVFTVTSLARMALWPAAMLLHLAVWTATSLIRMAVWVVQMLFHLAVWTATSLIRMGLWRVAMLIQFAIWEVASLARMMLWPARMLGHLAVWTVTSVARMVLWAAAMLVQLAVWTVTSLARMALWVARMLGHLAVWTVTSLARMTVWAAAMVVQWAIAFGPVTLILAGVAALGAAAFLLMDNWESIDTRWRKLWDGLKVKAVGVLNEIIDAINAVIAAWNSIPAVPDIGGIGKVDPGSIGTPSLEDTINILGWGVPGLGALKPGTWLKKGAGLLGGTGGGEGDGGFWGGIPRFAKGAMVTGPTFAMLGEEGTEVVLPLDKLGKGGMGGGLTVQVYMDGATILEANDAEQYIVDMVDRAVRRGVVLGSV